MDSFNPAPAPSPKDLEDEQLLVARLLHQLRDDDPAAHFAILESVRGHLERGGPRRARLTYPSLAFCGLEVGGRGWGFGGENGPACGRRWTVLG